MLTARSEVSELVRTSLSARNPVYEAFFEREATRLAGVCQEMSERFLAGGRLLAFGRGPYATDAQHVSVEFVHPVIVGKRALPALDLSAAFENSVEVLARPEDIAMGFGGPEGDPEIARALDVAARRGAMIFAIPGSVPAGSDDPFQHQEIAEILYHTLWETVHVFFERRELGYDAGDSAFLYPFLGQNKQQAGDVLAEVAASIRMKVADDAALRATTADDQAEAIAACVERMAERIRRGGRILLLGNGGSATDANDFALDLMTPPYRWRRIPAISFALEPAIISALANDVGTDVIFLRQLIAHAKPEDIVFAFSTSGGSRNIVMALEEARRRGLLIVALTGYDGGEIVRRGLADCPLIVRSDYIPRIQEIHASVYHVIRGMLEKALYGER